MKTYSFNYRSLTLLLFAILFIEVASAQSDTTLVKHNPRDTTKSVLSSDAIYNRPFLQIGKSPIAIGGYLEANSHYAGTDGVSDGLSFQFRRLTLFLSSTITKKIRFMTEIEFEDGTKEINIEYAALDFEFHPLLNLRTGIVMNPIGAYNQNHDGPRWEFVDRPISATRMLPATWSNVGFGVHGKIYHQKWIFGYEAYLTNGFDNSIIENTENRTFLPASKLNRNRFEESYNGSPLATGKISLGRRNLGEVGFSYMGGVYNKFQEDGLVLDIKRRVDVFAFNFNIAIPKIGTVITSEIAHIAVDVPTTYSQQFGRSQWGGYIDVVQTIAKRKIAGWEKAIVNVAVRLEYVDWNSETFYETSGKIYDHIYAISPGISLRPSGQIVLRLNYRYEWQTDLLGNPPARTAAIQFGVSGYF